MIHKSIQTEHDIQKYANDILQYYKEYDEKHKDILNEINSLLSEKSTESINKLKTALESSSISEYDKYDDIVYMHIIVGIYKMEETNKIHPTILDHGKTVEELINYYLKLKFQLWRLEFNNHNNSDMELLSFIDEYKISTFSISYALIYSCADILNMFIRVATIFYRNNKLTYACDILQNSMSLYPDNTEILFMLSELYIETGNTHTAKSYLEKVNLILNKESRE